MAVPARSEILFLGRGEVEALLPMGECIDAMADTLAELARGEAQQPLRSALWLPDRRGLLATMPAAVPARGAAPGVLSLKALTVFPASWAKGEETHLGFVLLFAAEAGRPLAILDASPITAIRTAAVSGVATRLLARPDAGDLALLGAGTQARSHLEAMRAVRPLRRVRVWSHTAESARRFAAEESERRGLPVEAVPTPEAAVAGADLVCTVSAAREPIVEGRWLAPGCHLNVVGASTPSTREVDGETIRRARLFVDRLESAWNEAGDLLIPLRQGEVDPSCVAGELGEVVLGRLEGRRNAEEVTLFKSLGLGVEDAAAGRLVYLRAVSEGRGTRLDLGGGG
jgi:ornithine cyclodeaminase/alanine dehydrogenase-like protein (mu-crystallin family)